MEQDNKKFEQILVNITGQDRPGLTAMVTEILARHKAQILDIGQADIHATLSLGILIRIDERQSGQVMKELLFKATELQVQIAFTPIGDDEYEVVLDHADDLGFERMWWQQGGTVSESFVPAFDATGVEGPELAG